MKRQLCARSAESAAVKSAAKPFSGIADLWLSKRASDAVRNLAPETLCPEFAPNRKIIRAPVLPEAASKRSRLFPCCKGALPAQRYFALGDYKLPLLQMSILAMRSDYFLAETVFRCSCTGALVCQPLAPGNKLARTGAWSRLSRAQGGH